MACRFCGDRVVPDGRVCNDRPDIGLGACQACGLVQLLDFSHVGEGTYAAADYFPEDLAAVRSREQSWNVRRVERLRRLLPDAARLTVLDFGCGSGGFLEQAQDAFGAVIGFDLSRRVVDSHLAKGWTCVNALDEVPDTIDAIVLFHVLEHVPEPWALLSHLVERFPATRHVVVEVPNTDEALNTVFDNAAYGLNHVNSEHLYYFTTATLRRVVERAGLDVAVETHLQRYSLANTFGWLRDGRGGGQDRWPEFNGRVLNDAYEHALVDAGIADSVFFVCRPRS